MAEPTRGNTERLFRRVVPFVGALAIARSAWLLTTPNKTLLSNVVCEIGLLCAVALALAGAVAAARRSSASKAPWTLIGCAVAIWAMSVVALTALASDLTLISTQLIGVGFLLVAPLVFLALAHRVINAPTAVLRVSTLLDALIVGTLISAWTAWWSTRVLSAETPPAFSPATDVWVWGLSALGIVGLWSPRFSIARARRPLWLQAAPTLGAGLVVLGLLYHSVSTFHTNVGALLTAVVLAALVLARNAVTFVVADRLAMSLEEIEVAGATGVSLDGDQFNALVHHSSDVILIVDEHGAFSYVSPSVEMILGYSADELTASTLADIVVSEDQSRALALMAMATRRVGGSMTAEWRVRRRDKVVRQVEVLVRNLQNEASVGGIVLNIRDVTERKELEDKLTFQALHDDLTGLPNRSLLSLRIEQALARWLFQNEPFSLIVVDLDDFKSINDSLGHVAGDVVIRTLAKRLGQVTRRGDSLVRLAGDEYAVLLEGLAAEDNEAHSIVQRIIEAVQEPMRVEGRMLTLRASVGLACVTEQVSQSDDIMRNADLALHTAKLSRRGSYVQFEMSMHDAALKRVELEADLRRAIEQDELQVYYQPTVDLKTGRLDGVEALLRWPHPERGFVSPADFIPIAEDSGLIVPIGTWVLKQACTDIAKWQARYPSEKALTLNVNLSGRQLDQIDVVETVEHVLESTGIAPGSLVLEMTESVLMDNKPTTLAKMQALRDLGIVLAIDDFGTGYSSLSYLRQFPIGILKIDRSFVNGVAADASQGEAALVQAIVDLARTLELETVAEGIETEQQLQTLTAMGCDVGQGYFLARPAPAEEVRRLIESTFETGLIVPAAERVV